MYLIFSFFFFSVSISFTISSFYLIEQNTLISSVGSCLSSLLRKHWIDNADALPHAWPSDGVGNNTFQSINSVPPLNADTTRSSPLLRWDVTSFLPNLDKYQPVNNEALDEELLNNLLGRTKGGGAANKIVISSSESKDEASNLPLLCPQALTFLFFSCGGGWSPTIAQNSVVEVIKTKSTIRIFIYFTHDTWQKMYITSLSPYFAPTYHLFPSNKINSVIPPSRQYSSLRDIYRLFLPQTQGFMILWHLLHLQ